MFGYVLAAQVVYDGSLYLFGYEPVLGLEEFLLPFGGYMFCRTRQMQYIARRYHKPCVCFFVFVSLVDDFDTDYEGMS